MRPVDDALQPCPFCGSRDLEVQPDGRVHCRACDAWGPTAKSADGPGWVRGTDPAVQRDARPEAHVGSLLLLGFTLLALVLLFTQIGELARWRYLGAAGAAAVLLLLSILSGAAQLALPYLPDRLPRRWQGLPFLLQASFAAAAALPMALAFLLD